MSSSPLDLLRRLAGRGKPRQRLAKHAVEGLGGSRPDARRVTSASRTLEGAVARLRERDARRIAVYADAAFRAELEAAAPDLSVTWLSSDFEDLSAGARACTPESLAGLDAVVTGGPGVQTSYRHALHVLRRASPETPVIWVAENFEFCRGTLPVPVEIEAIDLLVYNSFEQFFAVKDALLFEIEVLAAEGTTRRTRILGASETLHLTLDELAPERTGPICIAVTIEHPTLTRQRHNRFRLTADLFWKASFTTIHGSHQVVATPNRRQHFRMSESALRAGRLALTIPNYDRSLGSQRSAAWGIGDATRSLEREPSRPLEVVSYAPPERPAGPGDAHRYFDLSYRGYGTTFWYAFEEGFRDGAGTSLSANHVNRMPNEDLASKAAMNAEDGARLDAIESAGFVVYPSAVPIRRGADGLAFGFECDGANPSFQDYRIDFYDGAGTSLGRLDYSKKFLGPAWIDDVLQEFDHPARHEARLAMVSPDWRKIGYAPDRVESTTMLSLRNLASEDRDHTELQTSWRNLGVTVAGHPHWLHPALGVFNRTNLLGRVRTRGGHRTAVLLTNASGSLSYRASAEVELTALRLDGTALVGTVTLPAFTHRLVWLDELLPGLSDHLGESGLGTLQVRCLDADLCVQMVGTSPEGAVSLQHLWGY